MIIKTLVIDDEDAARSRLRRLLADFPQLEVLDEARNGIEAVEMVSRLVPDLIFLDVQMPGLDGFEVLRSLPPESRWPLIVFATAFDQYALAAFEANAVGYLLKPIDREKLRLSIERAERLLENPQAGTLAQTQLRQLASSTSSELRHVVARSRDRYIMVALDHVRFFRVEDGMVKVKTANQLLRTDYNLIDLEQRLPPSQFMRVHRSVIVNRTKIAEVAPLFKGSFMLLMDDDDRTEIQVSERQAKSIRELLHLRTSP